MRSTTGEHYLALDHIRAVAALLVFTWHFTHSTNGYPVPFEYVPSLPFMALLDEGHTGVALFMVLSGYLFAKLLNGKNIHYRIFIWNRTLRLLPLLLVVVGLVGLQKYLADPNHIWGYIRSVVRGLLQPTLPNGGWSITVEFHFYLLLPLLLAAFRRSLKFPVLIVVFATVFRLGIFALNGEVQTASYWTIVGRLDQFVWGMMAFHCRSHLAQRHQTVALVLAAFAAFYWYFDQLGGFYLNPSYPSPSVLWVFMPSIEGLAYAIAIAYYDASYSPKNSGVSKVVGKIGEYSYSIYLLHVFIVFRAARFTNENITSITNFYVALACSLVCFLLIVPLGYLSFRFIESPFLKFRKRYIRD
jgi:peptidoglycan/LPS O-acetylase OafA/YrhL